MIVEVLLRNINRSLLCLSAIHLSQPKTPLTQPSFEGIKMLQSISRPLVSPALLRRLATILAISTATLVALAGVSGLLLAFYYRPVAGGAHDAVEQIIAQVPYGWLFQSVHRVAADGMIILGLLQLVVLFLGQQFCRNWLIAWISGIFLTLVAIASGWTAMSLKWTQVGYWRLSVELGSISAIPLIGPTLRDIITGGGGIGTVALEHLYALHSYILGALAIGLTALHLWSTLQHERSAPQLPPTEMLSEDLSFTTSPE
jgi:cytochrome b6